MEKLTLDDLRKLKPGIFAHGIVADDRLIKAQAVRWVAVRGSIYDWAIYYHYFSKHNDYVASYGDKCFTHEIIRKLVPCTDEAYEVYRF